MFLIIFINNLLFVSFCCFSQSLEDGSHMTTEVFTNLIAKMTSIDYLSIISRSLSYSRLCRFSGVSLAPGFYLTPECTTIKVSLSILSCCVHLGNPIYHVPTCTDPPILPTRLIYWLKFQHLCLEGLHGFSLTLHPFPQH